MRNPEYQFVSTDTNALVSKLIAKYEEMCGVSVRPASPEKQFILWVASIIVHERVQANYTGNQNIPSRAEGENLDALAELFFARERPAAQPAICTMRFWISEAQETSILIPAGTRVTDSSGSLTWETVSDAFVAIGSLYVDVPVRCQSAGTIGNGYAPGQIATIVDLYEYFDHCENITASEDGADAATDEEFYNLLRASMDGYSCAGARGSYIYFAKQVSTEIADVASNSPQAGKVAIYVLMADGEIAGDEMKAAVLEACNREDRRPLTDYVSVVDPEQVTYNIAFTYYIKDDATASSAEIQAAVETAVKEYVAWQCGKLGRDINPDELRDRIRATGNIKRVAMTEPIFTVLKDGRIDGEVPQVAKIGEVNITNGGFEDE